MGQSHFRLLLWKSIITSKRSPIWTAIEVILPLTGMLMLVLAPRIDRRLEWPATFDEAPLPIGSVPLREELKNVSYSCTRPCTNAKRIMKELSKPLNMRPVRTSSAGLNHSLNVKFSQLIRNRADLRFTVHNLDARNEFFPMKRYAADDFRLLPRLGKNDWELNNLYTGIALGVRKSKLNISYRLMGPPHGSITAKKSFYGIYDKSFYMIPLALLPIVIAIHVTREITVERESTAKEYMHALGLSRTVYYAATATWGFIKAAPSFMLMSALFITENVPLGLHFLLVYTLFVMAIIALACLIGAIVSRPSIATLASVLLLPFLCALPEHVIVNRDEVRKLLTVAK